MVPVLAQVVLLALVVPLMLVAILVLHTDLGLQECTQPHMTVAVPGRGLARTGGVVPLWLWHMHSCMIPSEHSWYQLSGKWQSPEMRLSTASWPAVC